jgi:limonene-1,2-epoxide hydrolase
MEWEAWTERVTGALGAGAKVRLRELFAPGGIFTDPVTTRTTDIGSIEDMTDASFPDWSQEIISSHGEQAGGAFEWIGRGTLGTTPIELHGCTMIELDADGQVTRWRDYFDLKEIETQLGNPIEQVQGDAGG